MSDHLLSKTLHSMFSIFEKSDSTYFNPFESPLTNVARLVLRSQKIGIPVFTKDQTKNLDTYSHLSLIANRVNLFVRKVKLAPNWHEMDIGPMILFEKENKRPMALVSCRRWGKLHYTICDAHTDAKPIPLDKPDRFEGYGYLFQRRLPTDKKISWKMMMKLMNKVGFKDARISASSQSMITILGFMTPIFTGYLFGSVIPNADKPMLFQLIILMLLNVVLLTILYFTQALSLFRIQLNLLNTLQIAIWHRLFHLPVSFFRKFQVGDLALRADSINAAHSNIGTFEITTFLTGIFSLLTFGLLFHYDPFLSIVALLLTLAIASVNLLFILIQQRFETKVLKVTGQVTGMLQEILNGIAKIRLAGAENRAFNQWGERQVDRFNIQIKKSKINNRLLVFNALLNGLSILVIYACAYFFKDAEFDLGDFVSFNTAYLSFSASFLAMLNGLQRFLSIIPQLKRLDPILNTIPEKEQTGRNISKLNGEIEFKQINFRYDNSTPYILKDFSCRIPAGKFVAIVGPSGAGKSTLLRLLLGFEKPQEGEIWFDQYQLQALNLESLRKQLGVVLQNDALIPGTIFNNIVGFGDMSDDDAYCAAQLAAVEEDIQAMPMGLHTYVMEGAHTLSGGQKQRILLARALAKNPKILLLDEATSALDNCTQKIVQQNLEALNITRVVIAHRLSTIQKADLILVMNRGSICQQGTYEALANTPGLFRSLINRQKV